jgi:hypothetical protein
VFKLNSVCVGWKEGECATMCVWWSVCVCGWVECVNEIMYMQGGVGWR